MKKIVHLFRNHGQTFNMLKCPRCNSIMDLSFPPSFFLNIAQVDCKDCGYKDRDDGYSNGEAVIALKDRLMALQSEVMG